MRPFLKTFAVGALALSFSCGPAIVAQDHHDDQHSQYVQHDDWKKGNHIQKEDWDRGRPISDWQTRHLRRPPHGYEWRDIDGHYVLANPNGVIFQVVVPH